MKVVLYLRMSTDKQDASIPQQRDALKRHAKRHGHKIVGEYLDEGISGDETHKRQGFQKMIADAKRGGFERILCFDQDRFGRFDMIEAGWWITPLRQADVSLETIGQGVIDWCDFAGRLTYAVAQEGKHQFLRDLSRNTLRGQVARAVEGDGLCGGVAPYGYRREVVADGRRRKASLVIEPKQARVVRRIFAIYTSTGGSLMSVGEMLNAERIPAPRNAPWHRNSVRRILRNPVYAGDFVWGRTMTGRYHARAGEDIVPRRAGQGIATNDPIVHRDALPAIVSREQFDRAQQLLDGRRKQTRRPRSVRPLSGLIFCAKCGSPMHVNFGDYRCARSTDFGDGRRCPARIARGDVVLAAVVEGLQEHVFGDRMKPLKARLDELAKQTKARANPVDIQAMTREVADLNRRFREGIERLVTVPKSLVAELADQLDALKSQRDALQRQIDEHKQRRKPARLPVEKRVAECLAAAHGLRDALASKSSAKVNEALQNLGVRIEFDDRRAKVVIASMETVGIAGTCNGQSSGRHKSPEYPFVAFFVPIPPDTVKKGPKPKSAPC